MNTAIAFIPVNYKSKYSDYQGGHLVYRAEYNSWVFEGFTSNTSVLVDPNDCEVAGPEHVAILMPNGDYVPLAYEEYLA